MPWVGNTHLYSIFTAGTSPAVDEGIAHVDDATDPVRVGMEFGFEGLVLLVLALKAAREDPVNSQVQASELFWGSAGGGKHSIWQKPEMGAFLAILTPRKNIAAELMFWNVGPVLSTDCWACFTQSEKGSPAPRGLQSRCSHNEAGKNEARPDCDKLMQLFQSYMLSSGMVGTEVRSMHTSCLRSKRVSGAQEQGLE